MIVRMEMSMACTLFGTFGAWSGTLFDLPLSLLFDLPLSLLFDLPLSMLFDLPLSL